jgi:hypothetical protein
MEIRVSMSAPQARFLAADLTISTMTQRLGPPEQVAREALSTEKDERPTILTHHYYAHGAVDFVETDIAPRPGLVNHAVVDVPAVSAELFEGARP